MVATSREILEGSAQAVELKPALSEEQIAHFQSELPGALPSEIRELLTYSGGFEIDLGRLLNSKRVSGITPLLFTGSKAVELGILPGAVDLIGDGFGNFWVVDIDQNGAWGAILFVCHDPPVIVIQARDLTSFLFQVLEPDKCKPHENLKYVHDRAVTKIWRSDPWLMPVEDARLSGDETIRKLAERLTSNFCVSDLRSKEVGSGFSWGKPVGADLQRNGSDLVFGVEQRAPGILNRLLSRE